MIPRKLIRCISLGILTVSLGGFLTKVEGANTYVPGLKVYQSGSSPKIEVAIDMAPDDIIYNIDKYYRKNRI